MAAQTKATYVVHKDKMRMAEGLYRDYVGIIRGYVYAI